MRRCSHFCSRCGTEITTNTNFATPPMKSRTGYSVSLEQPHLPKLLQCFLPERWVAVSPAASFLCTRPAETSAYLVQAWTPSSGIILLIYLENYLPPLVDRLPRAQVPQELLTIFTADLRLSGTHDLCLIVNGDILISRKLQYLLQHPEDIWKFLARTTT